MKISIRRIITIMRWGGSPHPHENDRAHGRARGRPSAIKIIAHFLAPETNVTRYNRASSLFATHVVRCSATSCVGVLCRVVSCGVV